MAQSNMIEQEVSETESYMEKKQDVSRSGMDINKAVLLCGGILAIVLMFFISLGSKDRKLAESEIKLEQVNKVLMYDTILFEGNNLSQLQNTLYKDLRKEKQKVNYIISNQDLLVIDFNTREFQGNSLKIGGDATIDISYEHGKKIINYNNFSEEGRKIIIKQIDKNNYPKINIQAIEQKNLDNTYNITIMIDNSQKTETTNK